MHLTVSTTHCTSSMVCKIEILGSLFTLFLFHERKCIHNVFLFLPGRLPCRGCRQIAICYDTLLFGEELGHVRVYGIIPIYVHRTYEMLLYEMANAVVDLGQDFVKAPKKTKESQKQRGIETELGTK